MVIDFGWLNLEKFVEEQMKTGADGYAESAGNAVPEAIKMIDRLREIQNKEG